MNRKTAVWIGVGVGAGLGLMYLLDPKNGRRRRAMIRDKTVHGLKVTGRAIEKTSRHVANATKGVAMTMVSPLRKESLPVSDDVLEHRIRTKMGRAVSNPRAISVSVSEGNIKLSGPVLKSEARRLLSCVSRIRGVNSVENRLDVREQAEAEASLQGAERHSNWRRALVPTTGVLAATGGALAYYGMVYARERAKPTHRKLIDGAMNMIPFVKHNHVAWWQRPFA
jgi:hypothetical protein